MHAVNWCKKFIFCVVGITITNICLASDIIEVVRAEGNVATNDASGKEERAVGAKSILPSRNILVTGPNGRAVVRVGDSGYIVVEKNSKIELGSNKDHAGFLRHITGMIYYAMNAIKGDQRRLDVQTATATIGIRGTRFLVADMPDRNEIGMRKGQVSITSPEGEFEIHRKAEQDEFEAFKQEARDAIAREQREFEEYKADTQREFVEYKREFTLGADRMATFDGKRVEDKPLSAETKKDMESLESYAEDWLKEVRD